MNKYVIKGMIISLSLMSALTGCSQQAQAETNPTTAMETTVSETTTEAETNTAIETTKATKSFTEEQSILFEAITRVWGIKSDEEKVALGRGGLIELIKESLLDYTDSEYEKMADHILSQYPIPELKETVDNTKADNTKAENKSNTSGSTKAETNTSNTPQVPQQTQAPQTPEPVYTEPEISAEEQAEWEAFQAEMAERARKQAEVGTIDNSNLGEGNFGYDGSGDINLGGGM